MKRAHLSKNASEQVISEVSIADLVETAGHYLPDQAPLHAFVHHNTLHSYEDMPFKEAVRTASKNFNAAPFMDEIEYAKAYEKGRIIREDIIAVLRKEVPDLYDPVFENGPSRKEVMLWRLTHLFDVPFQSTVRWWLFERNLLNMPHRLAESAASSKGSPIYQAYNRPVQKGELSRLWSILESTSQPDEIVDYTVRIRDFYLENTGLDTDEWVHPTLIKLSAAYLDQGIANQALPLRNQGFLMAFWHYIDTPAIFTEPWMKELKQTLKQKQNIDSEILVKLTLEEMGIEPDYWPQYIHETLQSLRGWAGMFRQFELHPNKVPINSLPATLMDYLAIQLMLDFTAAKYAAKKTSLDTKQYQHTVKKVVNKNQILAYEAFVTAQAFGLKASLFSDKSLAKKWLAEHNRFNQFERRYLMQLAYERRHRNHVLDALLEHKQHVQYNNKPLSYTPSFQAIFCMDEREESTRRYLEELVPDVETYGCPGFFGVAMQYKGLDDAVSRPLCPVPVTPIHFVEEIANQEDEIIYKKKRKRHGKLLVKFRGSEQNPLISALLTIFVGPFKSLSLVIHSLFPKLATELHHRFSTYNIQRPDTKLALFRKGEEQTEEGLYRGYSVSEAATVVEELLRSIGILDGLAPFVVVVGHGSSSLNNPHEAAHDCGATGGGRGGPNARAFAMMANNPEVRKLLLERQITIPKECIFIGAYHNTANDSIIYYDFVNFPNSRLEAFNIIRNSLSDACMYSAQERCRRFEDTSLNVSPKDALKAVEQHAADLAQPRPEYGHATNAVCFIGRRDRTQGLYLDRRAFLISYNPEQDDDSNVIANILQSAGPVGAGISLEYYFSFVDPHFYGCGTKLPHNISGLIGVMNGHSSDLRTGLPWQMVEIHEPVRLLVIVEATPECLAWVAIDRPAVGQLVANEWIQLVSMHPETGELAIFSQGKFISYQAEATGFPVESQSSDIFKGTRDHLGCAHIIGDN